MADHDMAKCLVKRCICCSQVQNFSCLDKISCTSELIITLLFLSPELQIVLWPNLVWWCIIISCSVLWKIALLCSKAVNVQTFIECLSEQDFLKDLNFCSQTWHSDASSGASVMQKGCFAIFKVKVTVRACTVKTYHLYLFQNCWSFCNQT